MYAQSQTYWYVMKAEGTLLFLMGWKGLVGGKSVEEINIYVLTRHSEALYLVY